MSVPSGNQNNIPSKPVRWILSLALGHDASATVLEHGKVRSYVLRERITRRRHDFGVDYDLIDKALKEAGITPVDVELCVLAATQMMPMLIEDRKRFNYVPANPISQHKAFADYFRFPQLNAETIHSAGTPVFSARENPKKGTFLASRTWKDQSAPFEWDKLEKQSFAGALKSHHHISFPESTDWQVDQYMSPVFGPACWDEKNTLKDLPERIKLFLSKQKSQDSQLYYPLNVFLEGRFVPGVFVSHHMSHAASAYYSSPFNRSLVFTHDGGMFSESGFFFLGDTGRVTPIGPHYLHVGRLYEYAPTRCGFKWISGAGKLMGLSSYGSDRLHNLIPAGNYYDWLAWCENLPEAMRGKDQHEYVYETMIETILRRAKELNYDLSRLGNPDDVLSEINVDVASAVQDVVERTLLSAVTLARQGMEKAGEGTENLCLSGGTALNCPTNTLVWKQGGFRDVHVEPHCDDGGQSIGAAQYVYYTLLGNAYHSEGVKTSSYAMLGIDHTGEIEPTLARYGKKIKWEKYENWPEAAARDLSEDRLIAVYNGRSETGPRALGHRSILANPKHAINWKRVNVVKGREAWRPLAPMVLNRSLYDWFRDGPPHSAFMLFTYKVREEKRDVIPAVTHVDGSSRAQTITPQEKDMWAMLEYFEKFTGMPVVLNTSFNGPGEPIVEKPSEALDLLLSTNLDAVYLGPFRVVRA